MVIDFVHNLLTTLTSFPPDAKASGAADSISFAVFAAAHAHADKLIVHEHDNTQQVALPVQQNWCPR